MTSRQECNLYLVRDEDLGKEQCAGSMGETTCKFKYKEPRTGWYSVLEVLNPELSVEWRKDQKE